MTTRTHSGLEEAAVHLLDTLSRRDNVTLDLSFDAGSVRAIEHLMEALDAEARGRGMGISLQVHEGSRLCISRRRL